MGWNAGGEGEGVGVVMGVEGDGRRRSYLLCW